MDDEIDAVFERSLGVGAGKGVVDDGDDFLVVGATSVYFFDEVRNRLQINEFHGGVAWGLKVDHTGLRFDAGFEGGEIVEVETF